MFESDIERQSARQPISMPEPLPQIVPEPLPPKDSVLTSLEKIKLLNSLKPMIKNANQMLDDYDLDGAAEQYGTAFDYFCDLPSVIDETHKDMLLMLFNDIAIGLGTTYYFMGGNPLKQAEAAADGGHSFARILCTHVYAAMNGDEESISKAFYTALSEVININSFTPTQKIITYDILCTHFGAGIGAVPKDEAKSNEYYDLAKILSIPLALIGADRFDATFWGRRIDIKSMTVLQSVPVSESQVTSSPLSNPVSQDNPTSPPAPAIQEDDYELLKKATVNYEDDYTLGNVGGRIFGYKNRIEFIPTLIGKKRIFRYAEMDSAIASGTKLLFKMESGEKASFFFGLLAKKTAKEWEDFIFSHK